MDELKLLSNFASSVQPPSEMVIAQAREQLRQAMREETTRGAMLSVDKSIGGGRSWGGRRFGVKHLAIAAAAAIIAVAGIAVVQNVGSPKASVVAADVLHRAAAVAAKQQPLTGGPIKHIHSVGASGVKTAGDVGVPIVMRPFTREIWIAPDGSGRISETSAGKSTDMAIGPGGLHAFDFSSWPSDADGLRQLLQSQIGDVGPNAVPLDVQTFIAARDALHETAAPPAIRAGLFNMLAAMPNVEDLGELDDGTGRVGIGVGISTDYWGSTTRKTLIFDPRTTKLLGESDVDAQTGEVQGWAAYLTSELVAEVPAGGWNAPSNLMIEESVPEPVESSG